MSLIQALKIFLLLLLIALITLTAFGILKCKNTSNETFSYSIQHDWKGIDLQPSKNKGWSFFSGPDPTNGFVNYGDHPELIKEIGDKIRIDVQHDINRGETRKSIRLNTKDTYNQGLFILSADHMPAGLAVWPAFWLTGNTDNIKKWACNGEIDIIENVNSDKSVPGSEFNQSTLHTNIVDGHSCLQTGVDGISNGGDCQSGKPEWMTCGCSGKEMCPTNGCGVTFKNPNSAGWGFNKNGGGVYACELTPNGKITIWFFEKDKIPKDIESNNPTHRNGQQIMLLSLNHALVILKNYKLLSTLLYVVIGLGELFHVKTMIKINAVKEQLMINRIKWKKHTGLLTTSKFSNLIKLPFLILYFWIKNTTT